MKNLQEQTKQKIILELEHARLLGMLLLPLVTLFVTVLFGGTYLLNNSVSRCIVGFCVFCAAFLIILLRSENFRRARKYIEEL